MNAWASWGGGPKWKQCPGCHDHVLLFDSRNIALTLASDNRIDRAAQLMSHAIQTVTGRRCVLACKVFDGGLLDLRAYPQVRRSQASLGCEQMLANSR